MDRYVTGAVIKKLRESKKMTQEDLAERIHVSGKAVSKWETGAGFPDISLLEPLAEALGISVIELLSGEDVRNTNRSCNMEKGRFYVCPVCGNVIGTAGETVVSCCGINLPPLEAEENGGEYVDEHVIRIQADAGEYYVSIAHPMTKDHYISFIAAVSDRSVQLAKLYPEGSAEARFRMDHVKHIYAYCNRHGLFRAARPR
jgi:desulfoferrodoxin (superoxide reductase-like protein)/DNA-binding XRE family transcriptional regulator